MNTIGSESFLLSVLKTLEEFDIPYFVVGGFAAVVYGISRVTYDVDIVVRLDITHISLLVARYSLPRYYVDAEQIKSSISMGIPFNLIDSQTGEKADLIPATRSDSESFQRRVRQTIVLPFTAPLEVWCASVEDIILGKLKAWAEVTSRKHERDILEMLVIALDQQKDAASIDIFYIDRKAININQEAYNLWQALLKRAQDAQ